MLFAVLFGITVSLMFLCLSEMNEIKLINDLLVKEDYSAAMKQIDVVKDLFDGPWFTPPQNH